MATQRERIERQGRYNLDAEYPDKETAREAIEALQFHGFDSRKVRLVGANVDRARDEASHRVDTREQEQPLVYRIIMRALFWGAAGALAGLIAGAIIWGIGVRIPGLSDNAGIHLLSWTLAGLIVGALWGSYSSLAPDALEWIDTFDPIDDVHGNVVVRVRSDVASDMERAEKILKGKHPLSLRRFDNSGGIASG